jgi:hypothetical protein
MSGIFLQKLGLAPTLICPSAGTSPGWPYSGWMVLEWIPRSCRDFRIFKATVIKSWLRDVATCTEATSLDSESCQTCSSCSERTPSTAKMASLTSSTAIEGGTPWRRMKAALRTDLNSQSQGCQSVNSHLPKGKADEKIMTVIMRLTMGSK